MVACLATRADKSLVSGKAASFGLQPAFYLEVMQALMKARHSIARTRSL
jgi:hypothetical protein